MNFLPLRRLPAGQTVYCCWIVREFSPRPLCQYTLERDGKPLAAAYWDTSPVWPRMDHNLSFPLPRNWCLIPIPPSDGGVDGYTLGLRKRAKEFGIRRGSPSS